MKKKVHKKTSKAFSPIKHSKSLKPFKSKLHKFWLVSAALILVAGFLTYKMIAVPADINMVVEDKASGGKRVVAKLTPAQVAKNKAKDRDKATAKKVVPKKPQITATTTSGSSVVDNYAYNLTLAAAGVPTVNDQAMIAAQKAKEDNKGKTDEQIKLLIRAEAAATLVSMAESDPSLKQLAVSATSNTQDIDEKIRDAATAKVDDDEDAIYAALAQIANGKAPGLASLPNGRNNTPCDESFPEFKDRMFQNADSGSLTYVGTTNSDPGIDGFIREWKSGIPRTTVICSVDGIAIQKVANLSCQAAYGQGNGTIFCANNQSGSCELESGTKIVDSKCDTIYAPGNGAGQAIKSGCCVKNQ